MAGRAVLKAAQAEVNESSRRRDDILEDDLSASHDLAVWVGFGGVNTPGTSSALVRKRCRWSGLLKWGFARKVGVGREFGCVGHCEGNMRGCGMWGWRG